MELAGHVFPATKFRLVAERAVEVGLLREDQFVGPATIDTGDVCLVHDPGYVDRILTATLRVDEIQTLELPFSDGLASAFWLATGGTLSACEAALDGAIAVNLSGGFHHAFRDHGEGFCLIHDVAIAIQILRSRGRIQRALLVDLDVHQGNGSASVFADEEAVFTMSLHQENNYPMVKPPSNLDLGFPDGVGDSVYLRALEEHLAPAIDTHRPDLLVYLAGADPYREDRLGGLNLSFEGLARRDRMVFETANDRGVPVAVVLAGGYAADTRDTVEIHVNMLREAFQIAENSQKTGS